MSDIGMQTLLAVQGSIVNAGLGQKTDSGEDWMVYLGALPDASPEGLDMKVASRAICLYETPGGVPEEFWAITYPGVQVVVRGAPNEYAEPRNKIQDIFNQLQSNEAALVGDAFVYFNATHSGPLSLGMNEKRILRLAWNFRSMRNTPA